MGFFKGLFDNRERARNFIRDAYKKARADALSGLTSGAADSPHVVSLYSALANFYALRGNEVGETELWPELFPFLRMGEEESLTALIEYTVFRMWPNDAVLSRVKPQLNAVLRRMDNFDEEQKAMLMMACMLAKSYIDSEGRAGHPISWLALLDEDVRAKIGALSLGS